LIGLALAARISGIDIGPIVGRVLLIIVAVLGTIVAAIVAGFLFSRLLAIRGTA